MFVYVLLPMVIIYLTNMYEQKLYCVICYIIITYNPISISNNYKTLEHNMNVCIWAFYIELAELPGFVRNSLGRNIVFDGFLPTFSVYETCPYLYRT